MQFKFLFKPNWEIDNSFFNRSIMAHTQIPVYKWGLTSEQGFHCCFADGLINQKLSSVCDAGQLAA